jgi:cytochrome c biogenesis protein CcmG/thiol:disulfide interchange protein DsbE
VGHLNEPGELEERPQSRREWSGWLRSVVLPLSLLALIVGGLFYYQTRSSGNGQDSGLGTVDLPAAKNVSGKSPAAEEGRSAPDFVLRTLDGKSLRLSDLQGHPLVVNFWASWCIPCRQETPELIAAFEANRAKGLMVVGVNLQEANERAQKFVTDFSISYPIALDHRGQVGQTWRIGGPMQGLPASYFIDAHGVIQKVVLGPVRARDFEEGLPMILPGS